MNVIGLVRTGEKEREQRELLKAAGMGSITDKLEIAMEYDQIVIPDLSVVGDEPLSIIRALEEVIMYKCALITLDHTLSYHPDASTAHILSATLPKIREIATRRDGRYSLGQKPKLTSKQMSEIRLLWKSGFSKKMITGRYQISPSTLVRVCGMYGTKPYPSLEDWEYRRNLFRWLLKPA